MARHVCLLSLVLWCGPSKAVSIRTASMKLASMKLASMKTVQITKKTIRDVHFAAHATAAASNSMLSEPKTVARILNVIPKKKTLLTTATPPPPRSAEHLGIDRTITFTGCGGLYVYLFGVAAYMQSAFTWDTNTTAFASASAGENRRAPYALPCCMQAVDQPRRSPLITGSVFGSRAQAHTPPSFSPRASMSKSSITPRTATLSRL